MRKVLLLGWFFLSLGQVGADGSLQSITHPQIATSGVFADRGDCEQARQLLSTLGMFTIGCYPSPTDQ